MTASFSFVLVFVMRDAAFAESVPLEPQNGIPLVIVRIDESAGGEYGTIEEMNSSEDHNAIAKKEYYIRIRTYRKTGRSTYWSKWSKPQTDTTK